MFNRLNSLYSRKNARLSLSMRSPAIRGGLSIYQCREIKYESEGSTVFRYKDNGSTKHPYRMPRGPLPTDSTGAYKQRQVLDIKQSVQRENRPGSGKQRERRVHTNHTNVENQRIVSESLMKQNNIPDLFKVYMNHRSQVDTVATSICLARMAAIWRPNSNDVQLIATHTVTKLLLSDIVARLSSYAHKPGTVSQTRGPPIDPRMLASIIYSLGKLSTPLGVNAYRTSGSPPSDNSNVSELAQTLRDLCLQVSTSQLHQFPPRSLAMFAWGVSRMNVRDSALYQRISELTTSGICKTTPAYIPPLLLNSTKKPSVLREFTSPFEPSELAMLCTAFAMAGVKDYNAYDALADMITPLLPYCSHSNIASFTWAMTTGLSGHLMAAAPASNISSSGSMSSRSGLGAITPGQSSDDDHRSSNRGVHDPQQGSGESSALQVERRLRFLFHVAEELSIRLVLANEGTHVSFKDRRNTASSTDSGDTKAGDVTYNNATGSVDLRGIDALDSTQRVALVLSRLRNSPNDTDSDDASASSESYDYPERKKPFSPKTLTSLLHSFASTNLRPPQLFGQAAKYLSSVSAASGSDSSGSYGFRAMGTHPNDAMSRLRKSVKMLSKNASTMTDNEASDTMSDSDSDENIADVAVVSTLDSNSLSSVAWSFAKARFESPYTHTMWAAIQATMTHRMDQILELQDGRNVMRDNGHPVQRSRRTYRRSDFMDITPAHVGALVWSSATASVSAAPLATYALEHLRKNVVSYSMPSLAQVLWGSALQGVYNPDATAAAMEHVMHVAAYKRAERLGQIPPSATSNRHNAHSTISRRTSDPDAAAEFLVYGSWNNPAVESRLSPSPSLADGGFPMGPPRGASRIAGQLYTVLMGLRLEGEAKGIPSETVEKVLSTIPVEVQQGWRNARLGGEYKMGASSSRLHKDVARVLSTAKVEFTNEYVTPEGLLVDIYLEEPDDIGADKTVRVQSPSQPRGPRRRSVTSRRGSAARRDSSSSTSNVGNPRNVHSVTTMEDDEGPEVIDLFNPLAPGSSSSSSPSSSGNDTPKSRKKFALEVQGPSHFTRGIDVAQGLRRAVDGGTTLTSVASFLPTDMMIHASDTDATIPLGSVDVQFTEGDHMSTLKQALVPTLRTRAKLSWLQASGFTPITVDFAEWASVPSTQEKLELLLEKGLPIDERYI